MGEGVSVGSAMDLLLPGVEFGGEETGDGVVRDRDGVLVRASGFRSATLRYLSNGEGCNF
jgi:hypothetical protein